MHLKKSGIDQVMESSRLGDSSMISDNIMPPNTHENLTAQNIGPNNISGLRHNNFALDASVVGLPLLSQSTYHIGAGMPRSMQDHGLVVSSSRVSPSAQDTMIAYGDNVNSNASLLGKRENQDGQLSTLSNFHKRARLAQMCVDGFQQRQIGAHIDSFNVTGASNWKNSMLEQQAMAREIQYTNAGIQECNHQAFEGILNQATGPAPFTSGQRGLRYGAKVEQFEIVKLDELVHRVKKDVQIVDTDLQQPQVQQRLPQHPLMRSGLSQEAWNNLTQHIENDHPMEEDHFQKSKSAQSPCLSASALAQSPLSSKSGEPSSGSEGPHFGLAMTSKALGASHKEKATVNSVPVVGGTLSLSSSANDSLQSQTATLVAAKQWSNSLPKTQAMSVGSPASVSNTSVSLNASSPSVGTPPLADQSIFDRFSKIEMVTMRHKLSPRKIKINDKSIGKPQIFSSQQLSSSLSDSSNNEDFKDCTNVLSNSLVSDRTNVCNMRVISFTQRDLIVQGHVDSYVPGVQTIMFLSEQSNDGTVGMYYGDMDSDTILTVDDDHLHKLPNTYYADLLAAQLCSLMKREGYLVDDQLKPRPTQISLAASSQQTATGMTPNSSAMQMHQYTKAVAGQPLKEVAQVTSCGNSSITSSLNLVANTRMLPTGPQGLQISRGLLSGVSIPTMPQQLGMQPLLHLRHRQQHLQNQQSLIQRQHSQFQRSQMMLPSNPPLLLNGIGQNWNLQLGNQMVNRSPAAQLLQMQQQQQQQQQLTNLMQRTMMGLGGPIGMGNMAFNMVGLAGFGNTMGMGGARGVGVSGVSAPVAYIPDMTNVGQNPWSMNHSSYIGDAISQQIRPGQLQAAQAAFGSRLNMQIQTGMLGSPQAGVGSLLGARQLHPGSTGLSMLGQPLNRPGLNPMQRTLLEPMGPPTSMAGMNIYMNQRQQQQQQQETFSSPQAVVSPSQAGLPSTLGMTQWNQRPLQHTRPQPMSERQMGSGAIHAISAGNPESPPSSPQNSTGNA